MFKKENGMHMQNVPAKKSFRVDELAKELGVKKFVLKNWEKQFDLKKSGPDNKYSQEDFKVFATIKNLVLIKKIPQSIAKKHLQEILAGKEFDDKEFTGKEFTDQVTQQPSSQEVEAREAASQEVVSQEIAMQELTIQETVSQEATTQVVTDQVAAKMICTQEQEIAEIATLEQAIQEMAIQELPTQEMTAEELVAEELAQAFIAKGRADNAETTFQGAHEDLQSENIAEKPNTVLAEETASEEILAAQTAEDITDIKPALQEKEAFIKSIQSFKELLLKIHEQLK